MEHVPQSDNMPISFVVGTAGKISRSFSNRTLINFTHINNSGISEYGDGAYGIYRFGHRALT